MFASLEVRIRKAKEYAVKRAGWEEVGQEFHGIGAEDRDVLVCAGHFLKCGV